MVKRKSTSQNPFKYVPFTEQMARINADITKWQIALPTSVEDRETFFHAAVQRNKEMDFGNYFKAFLADIPLAEGELSTYAQLLYHQKLIFDTLLKHLSVKDSTSLATILDITIAFSRDMREDLRPYLWRLFEAIVCVIETRVMDAEVLQVAFRALAIIFKMHWRSIVKKLRLTFISFQTLFASKRGYVRRFAAEAFAFLLRKSSVIGKVAVFLTEAAQKDESRSLYDGISQLYFNALKGVMHQFHSSAPDVLSEIIDACLNVPDVVLQETATTILEGAMLRCVGYTRKSHSLPLFDVIFKKFLSSCSLSPLSKKTIALTRLLLIWITAKKKDVTTVPSNFLCFIKENIVTGAWKPHVITLKLISETILRFYTVPETRSVIVLVVDSVVEKANCIDTPLIYHFLMGLTDLPIFDLHLMPAVGKFSAKVLEASDKDLMLEVLKFYAELCSKRRRVSGVTDILGERSCFFDVSHHLAVRNCVVDILSDNAPRDGEHSVLLSFACCSYSWFWRKAEIPQASKEVLAIFDHAVTGNYGNISSYLALLSANAILLTNKDLFLDADIKKLLNLSKSDTCREIGLIVLRMVLPFTRAFILGDHRTLFIEITRELLPYFGHYKSSVRQDALTILDYFMPPLCVANGESEKQEELDSFVKILLKAEMTPVTIETYRDRLVLLRKLCYGAHSKHIPDNFESVLETVPLRIIIAQLYENFTIYWPHIFDIIESYAIGLNIELFWPVFFSFVEEATHHINAADIRVQERHVDLDNICGLTEKLTPDYVNFRLQLFRMLLRFPDIAERKSGCLSPLLLNLFRKECRNSDIQWKKQQDISCNIKDDFDNGISIKNSTIEVNTDNNKEESADENNQFDSPTKKRRSWKDFNVRFNDRDVSSGNVNKKLIKKTLIALLQVFSAFKSPKSIYMSEEIRLQHDELLLIGDVDVQKMVLKCIFGYRYNYLNPYRENFENLVEERTFLNELVLFGVDPQNSVIAEEHRAQMVPILMRLLYGKLNTHVSKDKIPRRAAIYRFLAGCKPNELDIFFSILFTTLIEYSNLLRGSHQTVTDLCTQIVKAFSPTHSLPLVKLKGCLNALGHVIKKLSPSLSTEQQTFIFRLCLIAAVVVQHAIVHTDVHPRFLHLLKNLRSLACSRFKEFFFAFQRREFNGDEINGLFQYFIGPLCDSVSFGDKLISPLNLLRLFVSWTQVPLLFDFLRILVPSQRFGCRNSVLSVMCSSLTSNALDNTAKNCILDGVLNLLVLSDEHRINFPSDVSIVDVELIEGVNFGTALVVQELDTIFGFIYSSLSTAEVKKKLDVKHLDIINRLGGFVKDGLLAENLIFTLLTYIETCGIQDEETLRAMFFTMSRLISGVKDPIVFLPHWVKLQSSVKSKECRLAMDEVLAAVSFKLSVSQPRLAELMDLICSLDAWDSKKVDEPDYEKRHKTYVSLNKILDIDDSIDPVILQMMAHNHYFNLTESKDISIRDSASTSLQKLIEYAGRCSISDNEKTQILEKHLIPLVLKGLSFHAEMIRIEFISVLVSLVVGFPFHRQLCHLSQLRDESEMDLDFFKNISHLQLHRRQRAFRRLTDSLQSGDKKIPAEVMLRFLLPLLQPYVNDVSSKTSALNDEAIRLLKFIMSVAPWKKYWPMLEYHLNRLQRGVANQKATLRIIVALIEAFHFNVSGESESVEGFQEKRGSAKPANDDLMVEACEENLSPAADGKVEKESSKKAFGVVSGDSVRQKILNFLVPKLKDCVTGQDVVAHRKAQGGKYYNEDEIIGRAPVALATVKLLQKLPAEIMNEHLHGIILKLCDFLMSRSVSVRETARKTLIAIVETLGSKYLPFILREIRVNLLRGYQIHVMIYSTHAIIFAMQERLRSGDLDACLDEIIEVCKKDLFSDVSEEKEISCITKDVPEAKRCKAFDTYLLLGRFVSSQTVGIAISALKDVIESHPTAKTIKNVGQLLKNYAIGLTANEGVDSLAKLTFAFHMIKNHIDGVLGTNDMKKESADAETCRREKSCLLLEKEPGRVGVITAKTSFKSRMFVFVEFGLQILAATLKLRKFETEDFEDIARLDPFVPLIVKCLELKYDKIVNSALRSFIYLLKFPLPSLKNQIQTFVDRLFILLAEYAALGAAGNKGIMLELSQLIFKAFTRMIRDAPTLVLTPKRLQLILNYVEADIMDTHKQATAFSLIKSVINRKLQDPKITELIHYLCEIAITSELSHIRVQCRQTITQFVGKHPQSKKPKNYVEFFLNQLEYEHENGRISAIEMLNVLFDTFNENANDQYCMVAFVKMAVRLVNDESCKCKRLIALAIRKLISSISEAKFNDVYLAVRDWLQSRKEQNRRIAMLVLVEIGEVLGEKLAGKLPELLPLISAIFDSRILIDYAESTITTIIDSVTALLRKCPTGSKVAIRNGLLDDVINRLEDCIKCSQSNTIQLSSSIFLGHLFSLVDVAQFPVITSLSHQLVDWICWQFKSTRLTSEIAEQASKNLVYLSNALVAKESMELLSRGLSDVCRFEIVKHPKETLRRSSTFKIIAALTLRYEINDLEQLFDILLPYLYREMDLKENQTESELQKLSIEVGEIVKEKIGHEKYSTKLTEFQMAAAKKARMRKNFRKEEAVTDPVKAALKKQKRNRKKIVARKRKLDIKKPYRAVRRKKFKLDA